MVCFDVCSLFTNVPIDEAVRVIRDMLLTDDSLEDRTGLNVDDLTELLEICLRSTYFSYKGTYYEQLEGAAMGSPASSIVADLYMEFFEALAISTAPTRPRLRKRYVDDTFCILTKGKEHEFLNHLNSVRPTIQFTMELESDGSISFLDCELHRDTNGRMISKVYRKKTHTDRYLHFQSHHPVHVKRGVV